MGGFTVDSRYSQLEGTEVKFNYTRVECISFSIFIGQFTENVTILRKNFLRKVVDNKISSRVAQLPLYIIGIGFGMALYTINGGYITRVFREHLVLSPD